MIVGVFLFEDVFLVIEEVKSFMCIDMFVWLMKFCCVIVNCEEFVVLCSVEDVVCFGCVLRFEFDCMVFVEGEVEVDVSDMFFVDCMVNVLVKCKCVLIFDGDMFML